MAKNLIVLITFLFIAAQANSSTKITPQQIAHAGLKSAQMLLSKAILIYESQPAAINSYIEDKQYKLNLKKYDRLNDIKKALNNSLNINLIVVTNSYDLANEKRECDIFRADAMVNKKRPNIIYLCPKTLAMPTEALAQVIVHELIHTAENRHEFNECETAWSEHIVMLLSGAGNPYGQQYYQSCGFFKKQSSQQNLHQSL